MDYRLPAITPGKPEETLRQLQKYLFQLVQEMNANQQSMQLAQRNTQLATQNAVKAMQKTPKETFLSIRDLIIKSADIVEAYQEKMEISLDGRYVAQSDFGTYAEQTSARMEANSQGITQVYQNQRTLETSVAGLGAEIGQVSQNQQGTAADVAALEAQSRQMSAYIRTGFLYEEADGTQRYGVEIGEEAERDGSFAFRKFARLTSDRLSFFDQNEIEVAYVSDRKLYITAAQVQEIEAQRASFQAIALGNYVLQAGADGHLTLS